MKRTKSNSTIQRITLRKKRKRTRKIKVSPSSGAKVSYIINHVKPAIRNDKPDHVILYTGTNEKTPSQIVRSIAELAMSLKDNGDSVIVSGIVQKHGNLNNKATEVNNRLLLMCKERKIQFISYSETIDSSKTSQ